MKENIKIGIPESIFSHLLIFLKNQHLLNNKNLQFFPLLHFNILENLFESNYLNLLISYPSYLYDYINKNEINLENINSIYLLDIFSLFQFSIFTHKHFFKFKFNNNITLKIALPKNTIYYKTIIKQFLNFFKITNVRIKWLEIISKDIEYYFENNILDVAIVFEKESYNLIKKNIANLVEIPINKKNVPGFVYFYNDFASNIDLETAYSVINEIKDALKKFANNINLKNLFLNEFKNEHKHFINIFLQNINNIFYKNNFSINKKYIYFDKRDIIKPFVLFENKPKNLPKQNKKGITLPIKNELIHHIINFKKIPLSLVPKEIHLFINTYNNLLFENDLLKKKLKDQINKNKVLQDDLENLKTTLYQNFIQLKDISDNLIVQKIRAEEANKAKSNFFASITHDLKTPLVGIISLTEMLLESEQDKEKRNKLKIIMDSSNTLLELINNILTVSKNETAKVTISKKIFTLDTLISEIEENIKAKLASKNVNLIIDIDPDIPEMLAGDPLKIKQIIFNLLGNSVKFTNNGYIKLSIKKGIQQLKKIELLITVEDTGIGIKQSKLDKIFLPFEQAEDNIAETYGGTGLGLAIVKKFVELMEGKISVTSKLNKGTTFSLNIFCEIVTDSEGDKVEHIVDATEKKQFVFIPSKILIAEDNEVNQYVIKEYLKDFKNIDFDIVENGEQALALFSKNKYDLVLTDIQMPIMDGIELCKNIRKIDQSIPVIAFTAYDEDSVKEFKLIGFTEISKKPYKKTNLFNLLSKYIGIKSIHNKQIQTPTLNSDIENKKSISSDINLNKAQTNKVLPNKEKEIILKLKEKMESLDNKQDKIKKLFIKSLIDYYTKLKENKEDVEPIRFILHNIKGTAQIGGLDILAEEASKLSRYIKENKITNKTLDIEKIDNFLKKFLDSLEVLLK